jgi:hypothetical protein
MVLELFGAMRVRRRPCDWPSLVEAIRAGAAYLAQGSSYSYLRARTLLAGPRLFQDEDFGFALEICKWEAFAVAAQDIILIVEAELRPALPQAAAARAAGLAALYADVLASEALPAHREGRGWDDARARFDGRLAVYMDARPLGPDAISVATAQTILEHAPILEDVRAADRIMVVNNVAMRFIDFQARLRREFEFPALARLLTERMTEAG